MAPEIKIDSSQEGIVHDWVRNKGGKLVGFAGDNSEIYEVDGERLGLTYKIYDKGMPLGSVTCSENHAKELEEAGIVSFQKVQETTK